MRVKRSIAIVLIFIFCITMTTTSFANQNNQFNFERVWKETKGTIQKHWYTVTMEEDQDYVKIIVTWNNPGQGSKETWYSLNCKDVIYHQERETGNKKL